MVAPSPVLDPSAPGYLQKFALTLGRTFLGLFPGAPVRLWPVAQADLPDATQWAGCIVFVSDLGKVGLSDGTTWTDTTGGAL